MYNIDAYNVESARSVQTFDDTSWESAQRRCERLAQVWPFVEIRKVNHESGCGEIVAEWVDGIRTV